MKRIKKSLCCVAILAILLAMSGPGLASAPEIEQANALMAQGDITGAIAILEAYVSASEQNNNPDIWEGYQNLGIALAATGKYEEASRNLITAKSELEVLKKPTDVVDFFMGTMYVEQGKIADAITAFQNAALANPENVEAQNALGLAYLQTGQPALAAGALQAAVDNGANSVKILNALASAYVANNQLDLAEKTLYKALAIAPNDPDVTLGLVTVIKTQANELQAKGETQAARDKFNQILTPPPGQTDSLADLALEANKNSDANVVGQIELAKGQAMVKTTTDPAKLEEAIQILEAAKTKLDGQDVLEATILESQSQIQLANQIAATDPEKAQQLMAAALANINEVINDPSVQDKAMPISSSLATEISQTADALNNLEPTLKTDETDAASDNAGKALTDKKVETTQPILPPPPLPPKASDFTGPSETGPVCKTITCSNTGRTEVVCD
ncbi:tetratricopeptide repeat protein [Methanothrix sp.]|uniref:tetratricopeptide repeat protein n=1 Tax=Methanothrix sp. TaxID=90426 RepID=UPI00329A7028